MRRIERERQAETLKYKTESSRYVQERDDWRADAEGYRDEATYGEGHEDGRKQGKAELAVVTGDYSGTCQSCGASEVDWDLAWDLSKAPPEQASCLVCGVMEHPANMCKIAESVEITDDGEMAEYYCVDCRWGL